jgi:drug/metabolite transporter (DMT)-like permease
MSKSLKGAYTKLSLSMLAWAGVYHSAHFLVSSDVDIYTVACVRYFLASIILLIVLQYKQGYIITREQFKQNWAILINIGFIGIGIYNLVFLNAEKHLPAKMVALIFSITPCLTALLSSLYFKTKLSVVAYIGMIVALIGAVGVINYSNVECGKYWCNLFNNLSVGEISSIALCFAAASFNILNRIATQKHINSLQITTFAAVFGCITLFIAMIIYGHPATITHQSFGFWLAMAYTVIIASVLAYFWYSEAIRELGVPKTVIFVNAIPILTVIMDMIFYHHPVNVTVLVCGGIIISGVIITNKAIIR